MTNDIIHKSSDILWNQAMAELANCADTVHEQDFVQYVKESGKLTLDNIVDIFDSNADGRLNEYDSKAWLHRSFLTQYVDTDFEVNLFERFDVVMQEGIAVDKLKLFDVIRALPASEEIALLDTVVNVAQEEIVLEKAFDRLKELGADDILQQEKWHRVVLEYGVSLAQQFYIGRTEENKHLSIDELVNQVRLVLNSDVEFREKRDALNFVLGEDCLAVEGLCVEIIRGDYDGRLQIDALSFLRYQTTQTSFDVLKEEVLRIHDTLYQQGKKYGINTDAGAFRDNYDKQSGHYRYSLHACFCNHVFYNASRDVRDFLAKGHKDFRNFDIRGADLSGLDFNDCDLDKVDLSGSDLTYTNLRGANNLNNITLNKARFGDVVWQGSMGRVWNMIEKGTKESRGYWQARESDIDNLVTLQEHTHYFSFETIRVMLNGASDGNYKLGLKLWGDDVEIGQLSVLLGALTRDIEWYYSAKLITEKLQIIRQQTGVPVIHDLMPYLFSDSVRTRTNAAYVIGEMFGAEAVGPLMKAVNNKDEDYHSMIMMTRALAKIHLKCDCVPVDDLMKILVSERSSDSQIQGVAIFMQEIHHTEAIQALWNIAQRADTLKVNRSIYEALATLYNDSQGITIEQMIEMSKSNKPKVLEVLFEFIELITLSAEDGTKIAPYLLDVYESKVLDTTNQVHSCVRVLCNIHEAGGEIPKDRVLAILEKEGGHFYYYIMPLVGAMELEDAVPRILDLLETSGCREAANAYRAALIKIHKKHGTVPMDRVIRILSAEDNAAREGAADILGKFKVKEAVPDLVKVLDRPVDDVDRPYDKVSARNALKAIEGG